MSDVKPTSAAFFEAKYRQAEDPWHFATSDYELGRYRAIVRALEHRRYRAAYEPGCSIGVLTEQLAPLCGRVDAFDFSPTAVAQARRRCEGLTHVHIECGSFESLRPRQDCDLLVLSEIGYYQAADKWACLMRSLLAALSSGATVLASHWLGESTDHVLNGDQVHDILYDQLRLRLEHAERHQGFRLDRWVYV